MGKFLVCLLLLCALAVGAQAQLTAPSSVTVGTPASTTIPLSWTNNGTGRTGTRVYRKQLATTGLSTSGTFSLITTTSAAATSNTDTGLTQNENYVYKLCATDGSTEACAAQLSGTAAFTGTIDNYGTTRANVTQPSFKALPLKGGKWYDPTYGSLTMRATDDTDGGSVGFGTFYAYWDSFNSDNTKLLIRQDESGAASAKGFNPTTFALTGVAVPMPATISGCGCAPTWESATWSRVDPDLIYTFPNYYDGGMKLYSYRLSTTTWTLIHTFTAPDAAAGYLKQMTVSDNDTVFAWSVVQVVASSSTVTGFLVYNKATDTVLQNVADSSHSPAWTVLIDEVHIDRSGTYLLIAKPGGVEADGLGSRYQNVTTGVYVGSPRSSDGSFNPNVGHGDYASAYLAGANSPTNSIQVRRNPAADERVEVYSFHSDAGVRAYLGDFHGSMTSDDRSWMLLSTVDNALAPEATGLLKNELVQVALDGSERVRRLAQTRTYWDGSNSVGSTIGYWGMPKGNISKDGRFIAWTSNWHNSGRYDLFVTKITPATAVNVAPFVQENGNAPGGALTAGGTLTGRNAQIGGAWTLHSSYSGTSPIVSGAPYRLRANASAQALAYSAAVPASADYRVATILRHLTTISTYKAGVVGRYATGADTGYRLYFEPSANRFVLDKVVAGVVTSLGTFAATAADDQEWNLELVLSGTTISGNISGVTQISVTDASVAMAGRAGLMLGGATSDTTGDHLTGFIAQAAAGGGSSATVSVTGGVRLSGVVLH